jgi:hypothetical protein
MRSGRDNAVLADMQTCPTAALILQSGDGVQGTFNEDDNGERLRTLASLKIDDYNREVGSYCRLIDGFLGCSVCADPICLIGTRLKHGGKGSGHFHCGKQEREPGIASPGGLTSVPTHDQT